MAGRGPAPKPEGQRRRQNVPERGEWADLPPLEAPVLPELDSSRDWHPRTTALWDAWRVDPASGMFGPAEIAAAVELAWLVDEFATGNVRVEGEDRQAARERVTPAELRLRMDGLGLTAKGKRDLRWRSTAEHAPADAPEDKPLADVHRLRAV